MKTSKFLLKGGQMVGLAVLLFCTSCVPQKKMIYMQPNEGQETVSTQFKVEDTYELTIQPDDQLAISISSKYAELVAPFNTQMLIGSGIGGASTVASTSASQSNMQSGLAYFQVDEHGYIDFPILGKQKVQGMTRGQIANSIEHQLKTGNHIKDAQVSVKLMSFKVTVLGEVKAPGVQNVNVERLTLLEALGRAGDLLPSGQRHNVKVIREENGVRNTYFVDLTNHDNVMQSPVYYLQQNDVVYVQPNRSSGVRGSAALTTFNSMTGIASVAVSIASLIIAVTK